MLFRKYAPAAAVVLALWALWLVWLWQPERQVRLHTTHFLKKVERRDWAAIQSFMADDFTDRWGHNKVSALQDAHEIFAQFLFLTIENHTLDCEKQGSAITAHTTLKISGQGSPLGPLITEKLNTLHEPFAFTWRRSGAPWHWQLIRVDQSELNIEANSAF
jgi:hypothetical protein